MIKNIILSLAFLLYPATQIDWRIGDLNQDGIVDNRDFALFAAAYNRPTRAELLQEVQDLRKQNACLSKDLADCYRYLHETNLFIGSLDPNAIKQDLK